MKTTSNKDMLNAIRKQASEEYKEKMPIVTDDPQTYAAAERALYEYPTLKNEFINTLTTKVVRSDFFSRVYENPLKMLKKGSMPYGRSIEELFVIAAEAKGFINDEGGMDTPGALMGKRVADVRTLYITRSYAYVFKVSISDAQLKSAFTSANGLSELVNQLVGSLTNGAEQKEYKDMIETIKAAAAAKSLEYDTATGLYEAKQIKKGPDAKKGIQQSMYRVVVPDPTKGANVDDIAVALRQYAGEMKFVNTKFNMAGVPTFCGSEDLVFLTTPAVMANLDVHLLATVFNVDSAEVKVRTILVDELPTEFATTSGGAGQAFSTVSSKKCWGILMDRNFLQVIDTLNESRQFENGRNLMTNVFLHKQGILANCFFSNCIAFVDSLT